MTGPAPRRILVGLEDQVTAGVVAAAAQIATARDATALLLLHVVDTHMVAGGLLGLSGVMGPVERPWRISYDKPIKERHHARNNALWPPRCARRGAPRPGDCRADRRCY